MIATTIFGPPFLLFSLSTHRILHSEDKLSLQTRKPLSYAKPLNTHNTRSTFPGNIIDRTSVGPYPSTRAYKSLFVSAKPFTPPPPNEDYNKHISGHNSGHIAKQYIAYSSAPPALRRGRGTPTIASICQRVRDTSALPLPNCKGHW